MAIKEPRNASKITPPTDLRSKTYLCGGSYKKCCLSARMEEKVGVGDSGNVSHLWLVKTYLLVLSVWG